MKLVVVDGPMKGQSFAVSKLPLIVGRGRSADACLAQDPLISRFHCQLVRRGDAIVVEDLGSGNGTFIDGKQVEEAPLPLRRVVRIGHSHFCLADDKDRTAQVVSEVAAELPPAETPSERTGSGRGTGGWDLMPGAGEVHLVAEERSDRAFEVAGKIDERATVDVGADDPTSANRLRKRLRAFQDLSVALAGKMETTAILDALVDSVFRVLPADRAVVLQAEESAKKLRSVVVRQRGRSQGKPITVSRTLVKRVVREKIGLLVLDALSDEHLAAAKSVMSLELRSAIAVPLLDGDEVLGVLVLDTQSAHAFTQDDLEMAFGMARQASLALANAHLYTELKDAYAELEGAHDQVVRSEKLSLVGTLAASIAHDIGNVMTPIDTIARLALRDQSLDPELKAAFSRQMERLKALTQQLLSFSRPKPPELAPLDINAAVRDSLTLVTTDARHGGVEIRTQLAEGLPQVKADASRLDQVFINLAINAAHAMKEKGGTLTIVSRKDGDDVVLEFRDTGPGIKPEHLELIFEPFFTTKGKAGTGMGLYSCRRIVEEEHHGKLDVTSHLGHGATFLVRLPAA